MPPLIIQEPRVSLIGGGQLPKASGAGVMVPDFARPFERLANDLLEKGEVNRRIVSDMEGTKYAEAEYTDLGGKDSTGYYRQLPPLPNGDPYFQAAYLRTRAENVRNAISKDVSGRFNEIQADYTKPAAERVALMTAHGDGVLEAIDPLARTQARADINKEVEQRARSMVGEEADRRFRADVAAIETRFKDNIDMAVSAASTGADYSSEMDRALDAVDDQVRLGLITPDNAAAIKVRAADYVMAIGTQAEIATSILDGNVDLVEAEKFALQLKSGGVEPTILTATDKYEPSAAPKYVETPAGRKEVREYSVTKSWDSSELAQKFSDPDVAQAVGTRLQEVINARQAMLRVGEKGMDLLATMQRIGPTDLVLPNALRDDYEKLISQHIIDTRLETPEAKDAVLATIEATKVVPKSMVDYLHSSILGNDLNKALESVRIWNRISKAKRGNSELGLIIKQSMNAGDVAWLDAAADYANIIGADQSPANLQAFKDWQAAMMDPANTPEKAVARYNDWAPDGKKFAATVNARFLDEYSSIGAMPEQMRSEFERAYQVAANPANNLSPDAAFDRAWETVSRNWQASPIFEGGIQPTNTPLENPPEYYKRYGAWSVDRAMMSDTAWASDYTKGSLGNLDDSGALIFADPDERAQFDALMTGGEELLGTGKMTLKATSGNRRFTQYNVMMEMLDGTKVVLKMRGADGRPIPIVLDHSLVLANTNARQAVREENERFKNTLQRELFDIAAKQYANVYGLTDPRNRTLISPILAPNTSMGDIEKFVLTQDKTFQDFWKTSKEKMLISLKKGIEANNDKIPTVPKGTYLPPESLVESRVAGPDAAIAAARAIDDILPDGTGGQFLLNIAAMESDFGRAEGTFRPRGDRGIWQINDGDMGAFKAIVGRANIEGDPIQVAAAKLKKAYGVDIANAIPSDLEKPLYSAAIARLYMMTDPRPIPDDVEEQGFIWKDHYNTKEGDGLVYGKPGQPGWTEKAGKLLMPPRAEASPDPAFDPSMGSVTDMQGSPNPKHFTSTLPETQQMALRLSAAWGQPLKITPHGGMSTRDLAGSQHPKGRALDIWVGDMSEAERTKFIVTAIKLGYKGIGGYGKGSAGFNTIHLDIRPGAGKGPSGLAVWWHKPHGDWGNGPQWFKDGIQQGAQLRAQSG